MKVFDGHSDMFTDITVRGLKGEKDIFKKYHIDRLKKGHVGDGILGVWIEPTYFGKDETWRTLQIMGAVAEELETSKCVGAIYKYSDIIKFEKEGKFGILIGMEGLDGLKGNLSLISALYRFGVRHSMLTWNRENEFATGVKSCHEDRGLTELGVQAVHKMEKLGMIIDVSHANEKTFWDIYENTTKPFIASHSNAYKLCNAARNLKDDQITALAERGGVIGINACPDFVDEKKPSVEKLADHVDYIVSLAGIDHVGFGFDFCDFFDDETAGSLEYHGYVDTPGMEDATKIDNLLNALIKRGYDDEQLEKICHKNMERVIKQILG